MTQICLPIGMEIRGEIKPKYASILTFDALSLVIKLSRAFESRRREILAARVARAACINAGEKPHFLAETAHIRSADWTIAPVPKALECRRVQIISIEQLGRPLQSNDQFFMRPRGWHLDEERIIVDGKHISGAIFDFALSMFHNAKELLARGSGPYFYLPKMESHLEARLWNDIFVMTQKELGIPHGTIKATVPIETILAAFEMDEILYELREHSAGLCAGISAGRWDDIGAMTAPFMRAYAQLLIQTCHKRHALNGYDGSWVEQPGSVELAMAEFKKIVGDKLNQMGKQRPEVNAMLGDLFSAEVIAATQCWLEKAVIGLNLCPFAKAVHVKRQIRYVVSAANNVHDAHAELANEIALLRDAVPSEIETTLLILPNVLVDFLDFNDFLSVADALLEELEVDGILQIASFHPHYQFADAQPDDIENYTNRSPYPTLHLLREESIARAVESFPDTDAIFLKNKATLKKVGVDGWHRLFGKCDDTSINESFKK